MRAPASNEIDSSQRVRRVRFVNRRKRDFTFPRVNGARALTARGDHN
jgi:hypothetical protein